MRPGSRELKVSELTLESEVNRLGKLVPTVNHSIRIKKCLTSRKKGFGLLNECLGKKERMGVGRLQNFIIFLQKLIAKEADFVLINFLKLNFWFSSYTGLHNVLRLFIFYQIFLLPQVKRSEIIDNKNGIFELPNDVRLRRLRNFRKV